MTKTFIVLAVLLALPLISTLFGGFTGWVVGLLFEAQIIDFLGRFIDTEDLTMWQIGASLGFIGGFFRTTVSK